MGEALKNHEMAEVDYMKGVKYKDIAAKYGVKIDTVKSWKKRYGWDRQKGAHKNEKGCTQKEYEKEEKREPGFEDIVEVAGNDGLTDKQRLFCVIYIRCFNATKAYQKAYGVKYETAAVEGCKTLRNPKIKKEIEHLKQNKLNREMLTQDDIFQKYMDIAFADMNEYMTIKDGKILLNDSDTFDGTLVKKVTTGKTDSIELPDRMKALQWLADHMDIANEKQRLEIMALRKKVDEEGKDNEEKENAMKNMDELLKQIKPMDGTDG